jgi:hypothetical protein
VKIDAAEYTAKRKSAADRDAIKAENKHRRVEGLALLKLPSTREIPRLSGRTLDEGTASDESPSDRNHRPHASTDRSRSRNKQKRPSRKEELEYEGRE